MISASTFQQAEEVLSRQHIALVFSDERLPDGAFRDLLTHAHSAGQPPQVVLTTEASDSPDPTEMAECRVLGTVRYPFHATDVELQIIRAAGEERLEKVPGAITH